LLTIVFWSGAIKAFRAIRYAMKLSDFKAFKKQGKKISMLTCYDYSFAMAMDGKVDCFLVGDSLGMAVLGYKDTRSVTMADMLRHTSAVARGTSKSFVVADLSYKSYSSPSKAVKNANSLLGAGAKAVKPEGPLSISIRALLKNKIPVLAHLGLTPQSFKKFCVKGRAEKEARKIVSSAIELEQAGAFALVLECIPSSLAKEITCSLSIPTIGIGAGNSCDGQVLVSYDLLGLYPDFSPRFAKKYSDFSKLAGDSASKFDSDVKKALFPKKKNSFR